MIPDRNELRQVEALHDLSDSELCWLSEHSEVQQFAASEVVVRMGDPADHLFLMLEGMIEFNGEQHGQPVHYVARQGEVAGMLPKSRMTHYPSTGRAVGTTRIALLHRDLFPALTQAIPSLEARLLAVMTRRIREATQAEDQRERLSALGKLSAGLAHELNNPSAAIRRDASDLADRLSQLPGLLSVLLRTGISPGQLDRVETLLGQVNPGVLGPIERADAEDQVLDLLDDLNLGGAAERAATLVEGGLGPADLTWLSDVPDQAPGLLAYLEFRLGSRAALRDIGGAAGRIGSLVSSVKRYSHMDRGGDRQPTDVRTGLDSTLTMLGYKLRSKQLQVTRSYADPVQTVLANEGELNQVWTNLIDNAIDALPEHGQIEIQVSTDREQVRVAVVDNGPGIPKDIQKRIFEPFFTTKGVGAGSGLGLDLVRRIVVRQHGGQVRAESEPGRTEFLVILPASSV